MKLLKRLSLSFLAVICMMVSCFSFVGCKDKSDDTVNNETGIENSANTTDEMVYDASLSESIFYSAFFNSYTQASVKMTHDSYARSTSYKFAKYNTVESILKDEVYFINDHVWVKDGKWYDEKSLTYHNVSNTDNKFNYFYYYYDKIQQAGSNLEFIGGTREDDVTTVYYKISAETTQSRFTVKIENNLITEYQFVILRNENANTMQKTTFVYSDVKITKNMPDVSKYTQAASSAIPL